MIRIIPNAFDGAMVFDASRVWPKDDWKHWFTYENGKQTCNDWQNIPSPCALLLNKMLAFPSGEILGHKGLVPDGSLWGGGMHSMSPGTELGLHVDSDHNPNRGWPRMVNAVLFLSQSGGGEFELWKEDFSGPIVRVSPTPGTMIVFATSAKSPHRVAPVSGEKVRKSLAVFWVAAGNQRERADFI
ncbi:MAG: 2OG-Fe(II) oxygenase [Candidatus Omnitrophica bacterium]|nr:2OG-Fe(II) oxygenase [Candidatus Omnitrophota bacterium]